MQRIKQWAIESMTRDSDITTREWLLFLALVAVSYVAIAYAKVWQ